MGRKEIKIICYADDATLVADNEDDLQRMLIKFAEACRTFELKISTNKTKTMTIYKKPLRCKHQLGTQISSYGFLSREVIHQANKPSS